MEFIFAVTFVIYLHLFQFPMIPMFYCMMISLSHKIKARLVKYLGFMLFYISVFFLWYYACTLVWYNLVKIYNSYFISFFKGIVVFNDYIFFWRFETDNRKTLFPKSKMSKNQGSLYFFIWISFDQHSNCNFSLISLYHFV